MFTRVFFSSLRQNDLPKIFSFLNMGLFSRLRKTGRQFRRPAESKEMAQLPKNITAALTLSVNAMLTPLAIPQATIDGALAAMFDELNGKGTRSITDARPLDRALTPAQTGDIIGRTTKTVRELVKRGRLRGIYGGADGKRLTGISEQSVRDFISGAKEG